MSGGVLVLGVGARAGVTAAEILELVDGGLREIGEPTSAIRLAATVETRREEPGIVAAARHRGWVLVAHPAALLADVEVPHPSATVRRAAGTPSVAEAACLLPHPAAGIDARAVTAKPVLLVPKRSAGRVTVAIAWHPVPDGPAPGAGRAGE